MKSFIEAMVHEHFATELAPYHRLRGLQGVDIPKLYGEVTVSYKDPKLVVHGLLLEFVPSFSLRKVPELVPKEGWSVIGDEAVALANRVSDLETVNTDVKLDNTLVATRDPKRVVMIDFGMARERRGDEDDERWRKIKRKEDEEGAVGYIYS